MQGAPGPARPASRCDGCHSNVHTGWAASAHARSNRNPFYVGMRQANDPAGCDPCHAPLRMILPAGELAAEEGITCDACHMLKDVDASGEPARLMFALAEEVRWGTICEAQEHYFHKTGCSPLFREPRLCAACHRWSTRTAEGKVLRVLTEHDEWQASPAAAAGKTCQGCHMPRARGEVATGWQHKREVGGHALLGEGGALRRAAVRLKAEVEQRDGEIRAHVELTNAGEAHALPTGFPGRQIVLEGALLGEGGQELERVERIYRRVLVDATGREAPFYAAVAEGPDNRLGPGEARRELLTFRAAGAATVRARVVWRAASPAVAAALGVEVDEQVLAESVIPLRGAPAPRPPR